jgi:hypothetical protein
MATNAERQAQWRERRRAQCERADENLEAIRAVLAGINRRKADPEKALRYVQTALKRIVAGDQTKEQAAVSAAGSRIIVRPARTEEQK